MDSLNWRPTLVVLLVSMTSAACGDGSTSPRQLLGTEGPEAPGLDNLALFTECVNMELPGVLAAYAAAGITAGNVLVAAPDPTNCATLLPALQKLGPVQFARQLIDGDADWAACGGTAATGTLDSVLTCYHDRIATAVPAGARFAGIAWSDEGEGKFECAGTTANINAVVPGAWARLYPDEQRVQMASGPAPQYCRFDASTTLASVCTTPQYCSDPPDPTAVGPSQWFTEDTFEPYKLKADPAAECTVFNDKPAKCCDGSTVCRLSLQTPCLMQDPAGWVKAALPIPGTPLPGVTTYVTMGFAFSNADCGFGGDAGANATAAAKLLAADPRGKNVALYTRN